MQGETYRGKSLSSLRYSLNRYLKAPPHMKRFDIIHDPPFHDSNESYKVAMQEAKAEGTGNIRHTPVVSENHRRELYTSLHLNPNTPVGLANKVQFDVRLYFCRRANENMESMTKSTFCVRVDENTNRKYVMKMEDELTKNHRGMDDTFAAGVMVETGDPIYCPVRSFERYISLLNPNTDRLWQYPKSSFALDDTCWFQNKPIGVGTLRHFMQKLSAACCLGVQYTNHSIRATGITILAENNFSTVDIMAVSGQRSVNSLAHYQQTSRAKKMVMAGAIAADLIPPTQLSTLQGPSRRTATVTSQSIQGLSSNTPPKSTPPKRKIAGAPIQTGDLTMCDADMQSFFAEENAPEDLSLPVNQTAGAVVNSATLTEQTQSMFQNCNFQGATLSFVFHKN
ncbi:uncharacterized protein [Littorina saxatilis]